MNAQIWDSYHNTNDEASPVLERSEAKAQTQEDVILQLFKRGGEYTPDGVWQKLYAGTMVPITSVRRAITNLTNLGQLEKTDKQRVGMYGKQVYVWRVVRSAGSQVRMF